MGLILLAILSFKRLKTSTSNWSGGVLLIDEIDATLHPAAQKRLIDLLSKEAKKQDFKLLLLLIVLICLSTFVVKQRIMTRQLTII